MKSHMEATNQPEPVDQEKQEKKKGKKLIQWERSRTAFERLQLAWIRTSLTLMMIGVGAYEYYYNRVESGKAPFLKYLTGRELGMLLIGASFIWLVLSVIQHVQNMRKLKKLYPEMQYSVAATLTYFLIALTLFLTSMAIFH